MRCRRICRELLWLARFGEFGPSSAPHLDHLAGCRNCRDEIGFDRALVQQLRRALAERIANEEPSARAWDVILARAQAPETGLGGFLRGHATSLAARLRTATAVSAVALAGIIATSTQVAITHPQAGSAETEIRQSADGERFERQPLIPRPRHTATPVVYIRSPVPSDPEVAFLVSASQAVAPAEPEAEPVAEEPSVESEVIFTAPFVRMAPADPVGSGDVPELEHGPAVPNDVPAGEPY
ncbi:MAG: hypothetical protein ACRDFY_05315 [Candidatus Limnocylindria bacterium]